MIKPLRDLIVAVPIEEVGRVGLLYMPDNKLQALRTHRKMVVLYAGPKADLCPSGTVIHASDIWGDEIMHKGRKMWMGRQRDINGIVEGAALMDTMKYQD